MDILYIVIPAYNEEETIHQVLEQWYPVVEKHNGGGKSRLVVVDDGSRDRTHEILTEYAEEKPLLVPLTKENGIPWDMRPLTERCPFPLCRRQIC